MGNRLSQKARRLKPTLQAEARATRLPHLGQAAGKVGGCPDWQAEPPALPEQIKQLQLGGTGAFTCRDAGGEK
jgi:hypothetical protein